MVFRVKLQKHMDGSYKLTDEYLDMRDDVEHHSDDQTQAYRPPMRKQVGSGAWIMVIREVPVSNDFRPSMWGIYWANTCEESKNQDGFDAGGRYKVTILVKHQEQNRFENVSLFPHEYVVVPEDQLKEDTENGYFTMQPIQYNVTEEINMDLIMRGRELTEDERSIIWSFQLEGLSETQACQQYFFSRHSERENKQVWYKPSQELVDELNVMYHPDLRAGLEAFNKRMENVKINFVKVKEL
jgi:hypothetical protein